MARYTEFAMAACRMALLAMATLAGVAQEARAEPRAVVELFTSQGCSSCPPADALLGKLAHDPNVIALTLAIDYWDYIGWKDTLALPGHTNRQKAYSKVRGARAIAVRRSCRFRFRSRLPTDGSRLMPQPAKALMSTPMSGCAR
jgi:hypothetical protein